MNYLHARHAGNFGDVLKHLVLIALIERLKANGKPLSYVESHAGAGRYSIDTALASEWQAGRGALSALTKPAALLDRYLKLTEGAAYPGSPLLARALLDDRDRMYLAESQAPVANRLRQLLGSDRRVRIECTDGYRVLGRWLPTTPKRCVLLIDPPYEAQLAEYDAILDALRLIAERSATAVVMVWYPIKLAAERDRWQRQLTGTPTAFRAVLCIEWQPHTATTLARMNGCGVAVLNAPYAWAPTMIDALDEALNQLSPGKRTTMRELRAAP